MLRSAAKVVWAFVLSISALTSPAIRAEQPECFHIVDLLQDQLLPIGGRQWFYWQLGREELTKYVLFTEDIQRVKRDEPLEWVIAVPDKADSNIYCVMGRGSDVQRLADISKNTFAGRYGMPGSGYPRCANDVLEGLQVRAWANRELGESIILVLLENKIQNREYILVISRADEFWILLDQVPGEGACYRDRGISSDIRAITINPRSPPA